MLWQGQGALFDGKSLVNSTNGTKRASEKHKRGGFKLEFDENKTKQNTPFIPNAFEMH